MTESVQGKKVAGVILAGGLARRMGGGDKSLLTLGDKPLLERVIERAGSQVDTLVLNANGDPARFADYGLPVVADVVPDFAGPLAGILTGMHWVREHAPECEWLVSFASDTPFFPQDLVTRLLQQAEQENAPLACAVSDGQNHPVCSYRLFAGGVFRADCNRLKRSTWTGFSKPSTSKTYTAGEIILTTLYGPYHSGLVTLD